MQAPKACTFIIIAVLTTVLIANIAQADFLVNAQPQENSWSTAAPTHTDRWQVGIAVVDGKIYAVGGMAESREEGPVRLNITEQFDPATNTWTTMQSMPFPTAPYSRFPFGVTACNGKVYAFGVENYSEPIVMMTLAYDPQTDSWQTKTPMPINASATTVAMANAADGKIYVMGNAADGLFTQEYDPATDTWTARSAPNSNQLGAPHAF
jgi:N-acetylneuraminic acid mutarotase